MLPGLTVTMVCSPARWWRWYASRPHGDGMFPGLAVTTVCCSAWTATGCLPASYCGNGGLPVPRQRWASGPGTGNGPASSFLIRVLTAATVQHQNVFRRLWFFLRGLGVFFLRSL